MMEEASSVFACGAGAITKLVSPDGSVIKRTGASEISVRISFVGRYRRGRGRQEILRGDTLNDENIKKRIADEESGYENALMTASEAVIRSDDIKIILITGGSCAGKTTTTKSLRLYKRRRKKMPYRFHRRLL